MIELHTTELHQGPTAPDLLIRALARWGDKIAFSGHGGSLTYRAALDCLARYQAVMAAAGVSRGGRVALLYANRADGWLASIAAVGLGACITPLHPLGSLDDHRFILDDAAIEYLVVDVKTHEERGGALASSNDRLREVFTLGPSDYGRDLQAAAEAAGSVSPMVRSHPADDGWLSYTGGTTGRPKGALRRNSAYVALVNAVMAEIDWPDEITYLAVAPITHVSGSNILPTLLRGGRVHMMPGFDPDAVLDAIAEERISATLLVPTMVYLLLDRPGLAKTDLASLELLMYGASPMSPSRLIEGLERFGPVFSQVYGQTEGYPISVLRKRDHDPHTPELFASCGHPCGSVEMALMEDQNQPVAPGAVGEICARAPQFMDRYWRRPEETAATLSGGWLHTGDMARADERGYLYIVDRKKDLIISGGFNVYPREVEDVLASDPSVAMAAVIGVPDEKWGEAVKAVVVPRPNARPDTHALIKLVRERKGAVHAPKSIDLMDEIPLTALGKPDKKALRARYWEGRDRQVG